MTTTHAVRYMTSSAHREVACKSEKAMHVLARQLRAISDSGDGDFRKIEMITRTVLLDK